MSGPAAFGPGDRVYDPRFPQAVGTVLGAGTDARGAYVLVTAFEPLTTCWVTARVDPGRLVAVSRARPKEPMNSGGRGAGNARPPGQHC